GYPVLLPPFPTRRSSDPVDVVHFDEQERLVAVELERVRGGVLAEHRDRLVHDLDAAFAQDREAEPIAVRHLDRTLETQPLLPEQIGRAHVSTPVTDQPLI